MTPKRLVIAALAKPEELTSTEISHLENLHWYPKDAYAEPGYSTDKPWVCVGNYNSSDFKNPGRFGRFCDLLDCIAECEWEDEWATCSACGKLVRTSGDCYGWLPSFHVFCDCELICVECLDPEEYLDDISDNPEKAITMDVDPSSYGWKLFADGYQSGFHSGQTDDPGKIADEIREAGFDHFVFRIDDKGQFDITFSVYVK